MDMKRAFKITVGLMGPLTAIALMVVTAHAQGNAGSGKKLFVDYSCYACHGFSGQNGPGKRLVPMKMPQAVFTAYVRQPGTKQMPSFSSKVLTDVQLGDIWAYVRSLPDSPEAKDIKLLQDLKAEVK
jgi:mono/diheme cytochrome c family protein